MDPSPPEALATSDQQLHKADDTIFQAAESAQEPDPENLDLLAPPASEQQKICASGSESNEVRPPVPPP